MNIMPGPWELLIVLFIAFWKIGPPVLFGYLLWRIWRRLQQVEQKLQEITSSSKI